MTKADIITDIAEQTGLEKIIVQETLEQFFETIKLKMSKGENIYFRGFGSFILKRREKKIARNISKNIQMEIPAHYIPKFKPSKEFLEEIKEKVKIIED